MSSDKIFILPDFSHLLTISRSHLVLKTCKVYVPCYMGKPIRWYVFQVIITTKKSLGHPSAVMWRLWCPWSALPFTQHCLPSLTPHWPGGHWAKWMHFYPVFSQWHCSSDLLILCSDYLETPFTLWFSYLATKWSSLCCSSQWGLQDTKELWSSFTLHLTCFLLWANLLITE